MKSFRDRNPIAIGLVSVAVIGALVGLAFMAGIQHLFERSYAMSGIFADAAGIRAGDDVRVAGVKAGRVTSVEPNRSAGNVIVRFVVDDDVDLGLETSAEIALQTLLGTKYLRLSGQVERPYLADAPAAERVIPIERTKTPFDVFELTRVGTRTIEATDTAKLNELVTQLADVTGGKHDELQQLLEGINQLSTALNERDAELRSLLDRADQLSGTLAEKDETLVALIDASRGILDLVERRQGDIGRGIDAGALTVEQLSSVVAGHKSQLDLLLETLHPTLDIVDRRQADLDRTLAWLGAGGYGLARGAAHGPWADIYVRSLGPDVVCLMAEARGDPELCPAS